MIDLSSSIKPSLLLFGATSVVGSYLLPLLAEQSWPVTAVSRRDQPLGHGHNPHSKWQISALPDSAAPESLVTHILSLGPCDAFVAWLAQQRSGGALRQIIAFGSTSAQTKLDSSSAAERSLAASLQASEAALARECERLGVRWTLLRPTLIYGGEQDLIARIGDFAARWHAYPRLLGSAGRARRQPVHAADLASAVMAAIDQPSAFERCIDLPGSEVLSLSRLIERAAHSRTGLTLPVPIPFALAVQFLAGLRWLPGSARLSSNSLQRMSRDQVFDLAPAAQILGFKPRPFTP